MRVATHEKVWKDLQANNHVVFWNQKDLLSHITPELHDFQVCAQQISRKCVHPKVGIEPEERTFLLGLLPRKIPLVLGRQTTGAQDSCYSSPDFADSRASPSGNVVRVRVNSLKHFCFP